MRRVSGLEGVLTDSVKASVRKNMLREEQLYGEALPDHVVPLNKLHHDRYLRRSQHPR